MHTLEYAYELALYVYIYTSNMHNIDTFIHT